MTDTLKQRLAVIPVNLKREAAGVVTVQQICSSNERFKRIALVWAIKSGRISVERLGDTTGIQVWEVLETDDNGEATVVLIEGEPHDIDLSGGS